MYPSAANKAVILIVDPDPLTLTGVAAVLDMQGYECHCARDSEAARKAAATLSLDLIICDVNVRGESGLQLCHELRQLAGQSDVPLMFVSTSQLPDIVRRTHEAGGTYYLRKPFDPDVLVELVSKALWLPHLLHSHLHMSPAAPIATGSAVSRYCREKPAGRDARKQLT
jgi:DNA-binding response OmpR family regulator